MEMVIELSSFLCHSVSFHTSGARLIRRVGLLGGDELSELGEGA